MILFLVDAKPFPTVTPSFIDYEVNSISMRDKEYSFEKPSDVFRIVVVGDSMTYGLGMPNFENVFVKQVESKLNANLHKIKSKYKKIEVLNGSKPGWDTGDEYRWLSKYGVKFHPDIILVVYYMNDPTDMPENSQIAVPLYKATSGTVKSFPFLYNFLKFRFMRKNLSDEMIKQNKETFFGGQEKQQMWIKNQQDILDMKRLAKEVNSKLIFAFLPVLFELDKGSQYPFTDIHDEIMKYMKTNDLEVFSFLPGLLKWGGKAETLWVSYIDAHPNEKGHDLLGILLYDYFKDNSSIPH